MSKILDEIESSIQSKIEGDADFQSSIADLSDDEKTAKIEEKKDAERDIALANLKEKADKTVHAEELANNYKTRAEKAEGKLKGNGDGGTPPQTPEKDLSSRDIIALTKANIAEEDMDEVIEYAKFKKISIGDALKSPVITNMVKDKEEKRKTAQATNTGTARRSSVKLSDDEIVERASRGEFPEDPDVLAKAQLNIRRKKN